MIKKVLLPLLTVLMLTGCSDSNENLLQKLQDSVKEEPNGKAYTTVAMANLTEFEWDTLYYFQEQETVQSIRDQIGFRWEGSDVPPLHNRLLFVQNGKVVSFLDYNTTEFPLRVFGCNTDRWVYPRNRSTFAAFKYCLNDKEVYAFIPEPCVENIKELMQSKCTEAVTKKIEV